MTYNILLFSSVIFLYNMHWGWSNILLEGQEKTHFCNKNGKFIRALMMVFGIASIIIFIAYFRTKILFFVVPLVTCLFYVSNKILGRKNKKRIFFPKTFLVAFVIAYLTTIIPIIFSLQGDIEYNTNLMSYGLFFLYQLLFVYCVTFFFDLRDKRIDFKNNIFQIEMLINKQYIWLFYYAVVMLLIILLVCFHALSLVSSVQEILSLWTPIFVLFILPLLCRHFNHDYWYYFFLDGIIMTGGVILLACKLIKL